MGWMDRIAHSWNAFRGNGAPGNTTIIQKTQYQGGYSYGGSASVRPDRPRLNLSNERSIISSIYTRLSIDVASIPIRHVRLDDNERFVEVINSGLNNCLTVEANLDQAARAFRQDMALSLCDKGSIAIVPVDTTGTDPILSDNYDIQTMRVGEIKQWFPQHVLVSVYNQDIMARQDLLIPKRLVAIVENPLYAVMNEPNSTLQRIIRKLNILDAIDEQSGSGKLDIILQLPYTVKTDSRREQAETRRKDLEFQMKGSKYGVGYVDATEKITQLNRPAENNILAQIEYLMEMLYGQLGLTPAIFNGTAGEAEMLNYHNRTIDPILGAITEAMVRTFLSKTARTQMQSIKYFRDPFKYMPISAFADMADKLTRNEIATSNELRGVIGWAPSKDKKADQLINKNLPEPAQPQQQPMELKQVPDAKPPLAIEQKRKENSQNGR